MLNNIVDNIEQCGQHNILQCCFQQAEQVVQFSLCTPDSGLTLFFNIVDNYVQCWQQNIVQYCCVPSLIFFAV